MPRQPGVKRAQQRVETREKILDATEKLLSTQGLRNVTVKDVAREVGVHPALIHYYFESKQALFDASIERRAKVSNDLRMAAFDEYLARTHGEPTVEGVLAVFLEPVLDFMLTGDPGWRNHASLIAQISNAPEWGGQVMAQYYNLTTRRVLDLLEMALPDVPREDLMWGVSFMLGSLMASLSRSRRINVLSDGELDSEDFAAIKARLPAFLAAGFAQMKARPPAGRVRREESTVLVSS